MQINVNIIYSVFTLFGDEYKLSIKAEKVTFYTSALFALVISRTEVMIFFSMPIATNLSITIAVLDLLTLHNFLTRSNCGQMCLKGDMPFDASRNNQSFHIVLVNILGHGNT